MNRSHLEIEGLLLLNNTQDPKTLSREVMVSYNKRQVDKKPYTLQKKAAPHPEAPGLSFPTNAPKQPKTQDGP